MAHFFEIWVDDAVALLLYITVTVGFWCIGYCLLFVGSCWKMDYRVLHLQALETRGKTFLRH